MNQEEKLILEEKCKGITTPEEMKKLCEEYHSEIVEHMLSKYKNEILEGKEQSQSPTIYIVGGQNASGKSKLISELGSKNSNTVSIIIDDMKAHHLFRNYIDRNFANESEELLHMACFEVFDVLLEDLLKSGYDIIIERTLGSKEKTEKFVVKPANYDYNIEMHVTATHEINSLLSSLERFMYECNLKDKFEQMNSDLKIEPRPISISHHDQTYQNICDVLQATESGEFVDKNGNKIKPKVFIWDRTPKKPTNIYITGSKSYTCAREAMYNGRANDLKRCRSEEDYGFKTRIGNIQEDLQSASPNSTLAHYTEFCDLFLREIQGRGTVYIGENTISVDK